MAEQEEKNVTGYDVPDNQKRRVTVRTLQINTNQDWINEFNQATFFNYDPNSPVKIGNDILLPPAVAVIVGGKTFIYPTALEISLNEAEINSERSYYKLDFLQSTSAKLVIVVAEYNEGLTE
jgi:hypothetical protein